jgi:hypothetical protein
MGASTLDLGGLTLAAVDLKLGAGQHEVEFREPTVGPLALLQVDSSMGALRFSDVGNASPRRVEVELGMGQLDLDLAGAWRGDSEVELDVGMGDCLVRLPESDEASGIVKDTDVAFGERTIDGDVAEADAPPGLPRVHIRATGAMGHIDIR